MDLRVLWASPLPPIRSGVSDYAVELLPHLARHARLRVLRPPGWTPPGSWPARLETVAGDSAAEPGELTVVHLGNNPHHLWLLDRLGDPRTVIVLHDAVLHHLLIEATEARGDRDALADGLARTHPEAASRLTAARAAGHTGHLEPFLFPARRRFLDAAAAVVVHSEWAARAARSELPDTPVRAVALAAVDPGAVDRDRVRTRLALDPSDVALVHLGFLTPEKGLETILAGLASAVRLGIPARLVVVGEGEGARTLEQAAHAVGIADRIRFTGWVDPELMPSIPAAADLGVVLRTPSAGETSAAALRFLACGVPVAVGGRHQYLEWPEAAAPRLTPGPAAAAELARLLSAVGARGWEARRRAARSTYERRHRPELVAAELAGFLRDLRPGGPASG